MIPGSVLGVITALMLTAFVGVVIWAYSARRKADFEEAARLPLVDVEETKR